MIGVINYETGNSQSVLYALEHLGLAGKLVATPAEAHDVDRFILPGVGSAGVTMKSLRDSGWVSYLAERVHGDGVPFLGICVGLQVLFDYSAEHDTTCLGWLSGKVFRFDRQRVRVPQIGWNSVEPVSTHPFVATLQPDSYVYFVNSYYAVPDRPEDVAARTEYDVPFAAAVARGNIMATQFHTEKSGPVGLSLLRQFASMSKSMGEEPADAH